MPTQHRIRAEAVVLGYALARLDRRLVQSLGYGSWQSAYEGIGSALGERQTSIKLLRDEFDVFFDNGRKGWVNRNPHPSRFAVLHEFESVSDEALTELARRLVAGDAGASEEIVQLVAQPASRAANVAERLLTGRRAEEFFMENSRELVGVRPQDLLDMRHRACGYDFAATPKPAVAIEVKGLRSERGDILFTDREWSEANYRGQDYWLVLVGMLGSGEPRAKVMRDPAARLEPTCQLVQSSAATWRVQASVV